MSQPAACSVLTLNMEGQKHVPAVIALLQRLQPDIVCLQEVFKADLPQLASVLGLQTWYFVPMVVVDRVNRFNMAPLGEWGLAILTHLPTTAMQARQYMGQTLTPPSIDDSSPNTFNRVVLWLDVQAADKWLRIATTHFTWSSQGNFIPEQAESLNNLQAIYHQEIQHGLLCGDFNAPRGGDVYQRLISTFEDHIPANITTTLDKDLHRAGDLQLVVDYLFTAGPYTVSDIQVHSGVSDHLGVSGQLRLVNE